MKRRSLFEYGLALLMLLAAMCPKVRAQDADTLPTLVPLRADIVIRRVLLATLDSIADAARIERLEQNRCGLGVISELTAYVDLLFAPRVIAATDSSVYSEGCPLATILEWHTHPPPPGDTHPLGVWCYLSGSAPGKPHSDLATTHREGRVAAFHMVHVRKGIYCWWSLAQIQEHVRRHGFDLILRPIKGQTSW